MDCSTPGFPVRHQLPKFAQTHVHRVGDAIQPSHPLSSPSLPVFNLSQHQDLFHWVSSLHQVAKLLELQLQHQSFQWLFRFLAITHKANLNIHAPECAWMWFHLGLTGLILLCKGLSRLFSSTTVQKHQLFRAHLLYGPTLTSVHNYWQSNVSAF